MQKQSRTLARLAAVGATVALSFGVVAAGAGSAQASTTSSSAWCMMCRVTDH